MQLGSASVMRNDIEIARLIRVFAVQSWRNVLMLERERANRGLDRASRSQRMRSKCLRTTYRNSSRVFAKDLLDREGLGRIIQLCRTGVRVDVIDLIGSKLRIGQRFAHGADARFAAGQGRRHVKAVVVETVAEELGINLRAPCARMLEFFNDKRSGAF